MTEEEKKLIEKLEPRLLAIKNSQDFVDGIVSLADNEEGLRLVLDFLDDNSDADDQDVAFFALEYYETREIPQGTDEYTRMVK